MAKHKRARVTSKPKPKQKPSRAVEPRVCRHCRRAISKDGPLPYAWDVHIDTSFYYTCSLECRVSLCLKERKTVYG